MTATTASRTIFTSRRARAPRHDWLAPCAGAIVVAFAISAISLLFNHSVDYDPDGWIVYAREAFGPLALNTSGFPAWKPLPVILIGPFTLLTRGGHADLYYWLLITRAGGILTVFAAGALAKRFAGWPAALLAAALLALSPWWFVDSTIGRDSSLSALFILAGFLAHYRGWYRWTVVGFTATALLRPEAWPLLLLYGAWMWRTRRMSWWYPLGALLFILAMWLVPTFVHAGLSPISISQGTGGQGTAVTASFPAWAVVEEAAQQAHQIPAVLLAIGGLAAIWGLIRHHHAGFASLWGRDAEELVLLGTGLAWVLIVAAETQKGFAGNPRYLSPGVSLFFVVAAVTAVRAGGRSRVALTAVVIACAAATAILAIHPLRSGVTLIQQREAQATAITRQLRQVNCAPGRYITNQTNNAYLAEITGQPLQDSINWHLPYVHFRNTFWFVYCAQ